MKNYRLLDEQSDHFLVEDDAGSFKVAKGRLAHRTVERIRQHFAEGGEVKSEVPSELGEGYQDVAPAVDPTMGGDFLEQANYYLNPFSGAAPPPATAAPLTPPATQGPGVLERPADAELTLPPLQAPAVASQAAPQAPDAGSQIAAATRQGARALEAKGQAESEGFKNIARQQEQANTHLEQMQVDTQKMLTERTARENQLFNEGQNNNIDPNRYWDSKSTGGKISAGIGLILGGIGAGLTKGPNFAVELLKQHIDRDMEAQRLNIGNKQNMLAHYMAQTRDLVAAQHFAKADYLHLVAGKIAAATANTSGAIAIPQAQAAIAQLRIQGQAESQAGVLRSLQIKESQLGVQYRTAQMGVFSRAMQQAGQPGTTGGISIHPAEEMLLPKEMQDTLVRLPSGKVDFARTPKDAEEVKKTTEATDVLRKKLQRYGALRQAHPNGISRIMSPADFDAAQALHESILTDLNGLAGLNRFTHEEAKVFGERIPDITSLGRASGRAAKLEELATEVDDKVRASNRTFLRFSGPR